MRNTYKKFTSGIYKEATVCTNLMFIYIFASSFGADHTGRTIQHTTWMGKDETKSIASSIVGHLMDICHAVNKTVAFSAVYNVPDISTFIFSFATIHQAFDTAAD